MATITVSEVVESEYGEKAILESPFEAKDWIKALPWGDGKFSNPGVPNTDSVPDDVAEAAEDFDWSEDYESHVNWNGENWEVDPEALEEAAIFWELNGFDVEVETDADLL
jgi:hypothetical protein